ncbi:hypothetical protein pEp_SNUABM04_00027 [Erwinia phage pEp_SNUABM_04]|nr:hypothetical protein pEp_SNUABM04_00027 [Erwinia phage pEp_SNUABM_04]
MSKLIDELKALLTEEPWSDELPDEWVLVESGDWTDEHKSESKTDVVQHKESGRYFKLYFARTGDYWQGYETEFCDLTEVEPYQKTITAYRKVKVVINE